MIRHRDNRVSTHETMLAELRLNQTKHPKPTNAVKTSTAPAVRTRESSAKLFAGRRNHKRFGAKSSYTVIES